MNKKLTAAILMTAAVGIGSCAYAEIGGPQIKDNQTLEFSVSTFCEEDITVSVLKKGYESEGTANAVVYQDQRKTDENGGLCFDVNMSVPSGSYVLVLSSRKHKESETLEFNYVNKEHLKETLAAVNNAADAGKLQEILEKSWGELEVSDEYIKDIENKADFYERLYKYKKETLTEETLPAWRGFVREQAVCALFEEGGASDCEACMKEAGLDRLPVYEALLEYKCLKEAAEGIKGIHAENYGRLRSIFEECAVVRAVCSTPVSKIREAIVDTYANQLNMEELIAETDALGDSKKQFLVYSAVSGSEAVSYEELREDIEKALKRAQNETKPTARPAGGGGGGGSRPGGAVINTQSPVQTPIPSPGTEEPTEYQYEAKGYFSDIDTAPWAAEAIEALYERGAVGGKAEGKFAPEDYVTREEFVKMLISALDLSDGGAECSFTDLSPRDWSWRAAASAEKYGIINGYDGKFLPKNMITRQDMAVMIYRALKVSAGNFPVKRNYIAFEDDYLIAGYAAEAVREMYRRDIIRGMDENRFAPLENATRAQAAKLIYEIIR